MFSHHLFQSQGVILMKLPTLDADKFVEKRRKVDTVGALRHETMIVMRLGERRRVSQNQPEQVEQKKK